MQFKNALEELERAKNESEEKRKQLDLKIQEQLVSMKEEMNSKITDMENMFLNKIERLEDNKADRKSLGKMLQNIGEKLQT